MTCRQKAQRSFGAKYPIATLQPVVYVCCCYFAILQYSSGGSQRHGTPISAGKHLCCSVCVTLGVPWKLHQISAMCFWKSWTSTSNCNIMADMLMHTATSTHTCSALTLPGPSLSQQPANGLQVIEATALCWPHLHRECCSVCQPDVLHHAKCVSKPEAL